MTNSDLTLYHKTFDDVNKIEVWQKHYYPYVWWYGGKSANMNKGINESKNLDVRIWYNKNDNLNINDFALGDIVVQGNQQDITTQQDLEGLNYYNIGLSRNNTNGSKPHIHVGGI